MIFIKFSWLFSKRFKGLAIFPFIFMKDHNLRKDKIFINHEKIHLRQQIEMVWIFFFIWYFVEFLYHWILKKNKIEAYYNISFEKEAYANEMNIDYLNKRKIWSFLKYL